MESNSLVGEIMVPSGVVVVVAVERGEQRNIACPVGLIALVVSARVIAVGRRWVEGYVWESTQWEE